MALASGGQRHTGMQQQPAILLGLVVLFASAMVLRLGWLQLVQGQENRARADENRIRLVPRHPMRGRILDRNGQVLVSSSTSLFLGLSSRVKSHLPLSFMGSSRLFTTMRQESQPSRISLPA